MPKCSNCKDQLWVCENHPNTPWNDGEGCCGGAGSPCQMCNTGDVPSAPPCFKPVATRDKGYIH